MARRASHVAAPEIDVTAVNAPSIAAFGMARCCAVHAGQTGCVARCSVSMFRQCLTRNARRF
jgi:hypothetical protein